MYSQAIRNLFVISGHILRKSDNVFKSFTPVTTLLLQRKYEHCNSISMITLRTCTTVQKITKDEAATAKLKELFQDPAMEKQYKILELEIEVMRQSGDNVPENVKPRHWLELLQLETRNKRR